MFVKSKSQVIGGLDHHTIQVWDLYSGETLFTLCGHSDGITALKVFEYSINSGIQLLASGSDDHLVIIWDLSTGENLKLPIHTEAITCLEYLPAVDILVNPF